MSSAIALRKLLATVSAVVATNSPAPKKVLKAAPLRCETYRHAKGSVCLRIVQETSTTTLLGSFCFTTSKGFDAFICLIKDCATGAALSNPDTNIANFSYFSCGCADAASARNANDAKAVDLPIVVVSPLSQG